MRALGATVALALVGASLVMFCWQVIGVESAAQLAHDNVLALASRKALIGTMAAAAVLVAFSCVAYGELFGPLAMARIKSAGRILAPFTVLGLLPPLVARGAGEPLPVVIAIAAFVLLLERLLRVSFTALDETSGKLGVASEGRRTRRIATISVLAAAAFYAFYMSRYTVFSHRRFGTYNYDLGQYDNQFWNWLHGRPLRCTPLSYFENWSAMANHAELGIAFFLPFYALHQSAETLLILQACVIALGAIPLYLFAARRLSRSQAAAVAVCYLLYPPLHGANFYDFHFQPLASTFVLLTIWALDTRRWVWFTIASIIAISTREDICIGLAVLGAFLLVTRYRPRVGWLLAVGGTVYFVVIRFMIMPHFGMNWFSDMYKDLYPVPDGPHTYAGVIQTLLSNPVYVFRAMLNADKLRYFLLITTPLAFLPLRRSYLLPALAPGALITMLTTGYAPTIDTAFQYSCHFVPYVFAASAVALGSYRSEEGAGVKTWSAVLALVTSTLLCTAHWGAFPPHGTVRGGFVDVSFAHPSPTDAQKARDLADLAAMVPPNAMLAVSEEELPHVSERMNILTLKYGVGPAVYILYGPNSMGGSVGTQALSSGDYTELATRPGLVLLKRKN